MNQLSPWWLSTALTSPHVFLNSYSQDSELPAHAGVPRDSASGLIKELLLVWNSVTDILTDTKHENHITLVVKNLHWLPVKYRIICKVLVINLQVLKLTWF